MTVETAYFGAADAAECSSLCRLSDGRKVSVSLNWLAQTTEGVGSVLPQV